MRSDHKKEYNMAVRKTEEYYSDLFYRRLVELRQQKEVSAREMSLALGQGPGYINNIENRKNLPSMSAFFNICVYLEVEPEEFFSEENRTPGRLRELIGNLQKLDRKRLDDIASLVEALVK